jgi:hypothetical protein
VLPVKATCKLCGESVPLLDSHILPSFAFKAMKKGAATGHIRNTENPNQRVQDGFKQPWLCGQCEGRFGRWASVVSPRKPQGLQKPT